MQLINQETTPDLRGLTQRFISLSQHNPLSFHQLKKNEKKRKDKQINTLYVFRERKGNENGRGT